MSHTLYSVIRNMGDNSNRIVNTIYSDTVEESNSVIKDVPNGNIKEEANSTDVTYGVVPTHKSDSDVYAYMLLLIE